MTTTTKLYIAYGSNMNRAQMARRCPKAKALRAIMIDDARLVFRGVADIEYKAGASVPVVLWAITAECEAALDKFEGVAQGVYEKKFVPLDNGEQALVYVMRSRGVAPPQREYYERIRAGYEDFGIDQEPLDVALKHSHVNTAHDANTRRRQAKHMAAGSHRIAPRPMHVPLSAARDTAPAVTTKREAAGLCKHGWPFEVCEECNQPRLDLAPPARPLDGGYNWSAKARTNSAKAKARKPGKRTDANGMRYKNLNDYLKDKYH